MQNVFYFLLLWIFQALLYGRCCGNALKVYFLQNVFCFIFKWIFQVLLYCRCCGKAVMYFFAEYFLFPFAVNISSHLVQQMLWRSSKSSFFCIKFIVSFSCEYFKPSCGNEVKVYFFAKCFLLYFHKKISSPFVLQMLWQSSKSFFAECFLLHLRTGK